MTTITRAKPKRSVNDPTGKGKGPPLDHLFDQASLERSKSRTEEVHEALRQAIIEQRLKPGAKLPEDQIGEAFGTSRTIAREALGRLGVEGLVELKQNRGAFVANPTLEEGRHAFYVRRGLERLVTDSLAGRLKDKEIAYLRTLLAREREAFDRDPKEAIRLAGEFHITLARLTGNGVLTRYVNEVVCRCSLILAMYARPHSADSGVSEHEAIVDALAQGSASKAGQLMDDHVAAVADRALLQQRAERDDLRGILAPYAARLKD
jgi:DNA-binding GntR family transcriptional regulator